MCQKIGSEFDAWASGYSELMERIVPYYRTLIEDLFSLVPESLSVAHIVELGCGNGNLLKYAQMKYPSAALTGVDASAEMLEELLGRFQGEEVNTILGLMQEVAFPREQVDLVLASFSMHHLITDQKKVVIENAMQWLRPGGYFLYSDLMVEEGSQDHDDLLKHWKEFILQEGTEADWEWLLAHHRDYDRVESEAQLTTKFLGSGYNTIQTIRHEEKWVALAAQR